MKLSICTTLYKSAPYVAEFIRRSTCVAKELVGEEYEIIMVDDGSPDNSLDIACSLALTDPHIKVVELSRNFGHHKALMTATKCAQGDLVYLLDSDLEEEPEWLLAFYDTLEKDRCDVVYGVQESRKGKWFERISGQIAHSLFTFFIGKGVPRNVCTARLMSRNYVENLLKFEERELLILGLWHSAGFRQCPYPVKKHNTSPTTYSFIAKYNHLINGVLSFSAIPMSIIFYVGLVIFLLSVLYSLYLFALWFLGASMLSGWTSVMLSIWLLGGIIISFIGLIGMYMAKIFIEVKHRPYTIIREIYQVKKC